MPALSLNAVRTLLSVSILCALAACGGDGGSSDSSNGAITVGGTPTPTPGATPAPIGAPINGNPTATPAPTSPTPTPTPGPTPAPAPVTASFSISAFPVAVSGGGKVFNMADNFFDDVWLPAAPVYNYGFPNALIQYVNTDGSLDVAWLDYSSGGGGPKASGLNTLGHIFITHINANLTAGATVDTGITTYRLLGFTKDPSGNYYLAFNADHSFKTSTAGDLNNVNGNELRIAKSTGPSFVSAAWNTLIFGDNDNNQDRTPGNAGEAGGGVLAFDVANQAVVSYVAHQMNWKSGTVSTRHQAGIMRLVSASTGAVITPSGDASGSGAGWFYSHNFDQRLIVDNGNYYTLAHGDAYSRTLGISGWTNASYRNNGTVFDHSYWNIPGNEGDNNTNSEEGQFVRLANGNFAVVHTTSDGRAARDVRAVLASGNDGSTLSEIWLTTNATNKQAVMPKIAAVGSNFLLTYGVWDSTNRTNHSINWYGQLLNSSLAPISAVQNITGVEFVTDLPSFTFPAGPHAGAVGWVSGNGSHGLTVNVVVQN